MANRDFMKATHYRFSSNRSGRKTGHAGNVSWSSIRRDIHLHTLPYPELLSPDVAEFRGTTESYSGLADALAAARLLSISFDPEFDRPEILKQYAQHAGAVPALWTFATGEPDEIHKLTKAFSIFIQPEGGTISHGLATALIDRDGKILKIWRGNGWSPTEIITELKRL